MATSIRGTVIELIQKGLSNKEIWATIQPMFNMPAYHKHYPAWYRNEQKRIARGKAEHAQHNAQLAQEVADIAAQTSAEDI